MIGRLHLVRLWRSRRPHLAALSLALFLGLMLLGFYTDVMKTTGGEAVFGFSLSNDSYNNGLAFALLAFFYGSLFVLPIFAATEAGAQIAGDTSSGTILLLLTRPLKRGRLFLTKLALASGFLFVLAGVLLVVALLLGLVAVGWGDFLDNPGGFDSPTASPHLTLGQTLLRFVLAWPAATLGILALLSMSFLLSTWVRKPVNAVGASMALYAVMYVLSVLPIFEGLSPWLFTTYMPFWTELFEARIPWSELLLDAAALAGFALLFASLAYRRFRLREER